MGAPSVAHAPSGEQHGVHSAVEFTLTGQSFTMAEFPWCVNFTPDSMLAVRELHAVESKADCGSFKSSSSEWQRHIRWVKLEQSRGCVNAMTVG